MKKTSWWLCFAVCASGTTILQAEEVLLFKGEVPTARAFKAPLALAGITDAEWAKGEITFNITASNQKPSWTIFGMADVMYLTDGVNKMPMKEPVNGHMGSIQTGHPLKLTFPLPPLGRQNGVTFENSRGVYSWSAPPENPYTLEVWKGVRPVLQGHVDQMNRSWTVYASVSDEKAIRYHYTTPDGKTFSTALPSHRGRLRPGQKPFTVKVRIDLADGGRAEGSVPVTPHTEPLGVPLKPENIQVGISYIRRDQEPTTNMPPDSIYGKWQGQVRNTRDFYEKDLADLYVIWPLEDEDFGKERDSLLEGLARHGKSFMTIYRADGPEFLNRCRELFGGRFLENNIGEYAGYLYQGRNEAKACIGIIDDTDLRTARDRFINHYIGATRNNHGRYKYIFSTSGSALAHYELTGGIDYMCSELYALGAMNVAYATAEMRGAARRWKPEYWGGWLAHEWQTGGVPYTVPQKYDSLKVGLCQQYLMGTSVIVLESGADGTQAAPHTAVEEGMTKTGTNYNYHAKPPAEYRRTMKEFYDFVRANPRPAGSPETKIAMLLGNCDAYVGMSHGGFAIWAQHETAETNSNWKYGDPELTWQAAQSVFFPTPQDAIAPWKNAWVGGSPHGQVDVVGVDEDLWRGELSRYDFAAFTGWNSMVPELVDALDDYVKNGGTLFISVPHLSTRFDREYKNYVAGDLIGGGDLSALIDVKIEGRGEPVKSSGDLRVTNGGKMPPARLGDGATLARAKLGAGVKVMVATGDGHPVMVSQERGKGRVGLLLTWEYPGVPAIAPLYKDLLRHFAGNVRQSITIEPVPGNEADVDYIAFAAYPGKAFFVNADCVAERAVIATIDGKRGKLTLKPTEMRVMERGKYK